VDGVYYWVGIIFITALVLGACNAANLIDGLDGLLSGSVGIMALGFVVVSVMLMIVDHRESVPIPGTISEMSVIDEIRGDSTQSEKRMLWERSLPGDEPPFVLVSQDLDGDGVWDERDVALMDDYIEYRATPQVDWLAGPRLVLSLAILGACLGFLPFNFNPAVIFLGDAGSLLLGYLCAVIILSLGSEGQTHYVIAGLIIFALPIMDTVLAILRRKLAGLPMSEPDRNHIHHILLRSFKSVKKAVVVLYCIDLVFVLIGVGLAAAVAFGFARYLLVYGVAIVFFGLVGATATKAALRHRWVMQATEEHAAKPTGEPAEPTVAKPERDPA
jgi:UDP-N-acetylmuramyl pentapeptide phosphotransferase/UDP-N-acetylglucosamine-1-phosphate transferase